MSFCYDFGGLTTFGHEMIFFEWKKLIICNQNNFRRHSSTDDEDEEEMDSSSIDFKLKQSAIRNNLTPQNVKNILQVRYLTSKMCL